jgi:hypothetical protein
MRKIAQLILTLLLLGCSTATFAQVAYEIQWDYAGTRYNGLLWQGQNNSWYMRVSYWAYGGMNVVEQDMRPSVDENGLYLFGYSPRFLVYQSPTMLYSADNIMVTQVGNTTYMYTIDDSGQLSAVHSVKPIYTLDYYYTVRRVRYGG